MMKLNKFVLTMTTAVLLPVFANAATDPVTASFERDFSHEPVLTTTAIAWSNDPLDNFYSLLSIKQDAVVASFERDFYHEPVLTTTAIVWSNDPLDEVNAALNSESDAVLASFYRDLYRMPAVFAVESGKISLPGVVKLSSGKLPQSL